uniref:Homeobox domain-containing protein n=1 Tax=Meloidogyne incognita TaxID=6306 RepID=A0A914KTL7_MELIC
MAPDMFPVRVLVETVRSQHCIGCAHDGNPLVDTFAVVGGQTMLSQLVETVLAALGLPQLIQDSKGLIQINGWKPISFEAITDNPEELVSNLFREISTHMTLKILAKHSQSESNGQCLTELKQRLLKTAIEQQPRILTTANGQEVKEILQNVIQNDQQCSAWSNREQMQAVNEWLEQMATQQDENNKKSSNYGTRFSPLSEMPRLERWFRSDSNPSRQKLISYMNILNSSQYRRVNNKVTYQQICNWFANQRRTMQRLAAQQQQAQAVQATQQQQRQSCSSNSSSSGTAVNGIVGNGGSGGGPLAILPLNATGVGNNNNIAAVENQVQEQQSQQNQSCSSASSPGVVVNVGSNGGGIHSMNQPLTSLMPSNAVSNVGGGSGGNIENQTSLNHQHHQNLSNNNSNTNLFYSLASALATGNMDTAIHLQQKMASLFASGLNNSNNDGKSVENDENNVHIPLANGPPIVDIRSKFVDNNGNNSMDFSHQQSCSSTNDSNNNNNFSSAYSLSASNNMANNNTATALINNVGSSPSYSSISPIKLESGLLNFKLENEFSSPPPQQNNNLNIDGQNNVGANGGNGNSANQSRSRLMFDPLSELPILERWFDDNPHPGWLQIEQYTDYLNSMTYRQNYPPVSTHNVKIWFKNRRAKTKRLLNNSEASGVVGGGSAA